MGFKRRAERVSKLCKPARFESRALALDSESLSGPLPHVVADHVVFASPPHQVATKRTLRVDAANEDSRMRPAASPAVSKSVRAVVTASQDI